LNWRQAIPEFRSDGLYIIGECVVAHDEVAAQEGLADALTRPRPRRLLEIGYGLGLAHRQLRRDPPAEHWVVEGNEELAKACVAANTGTLPVPRVLRDTWEHVVASAPRRYFDAVLFDPYPFDAEARYMEGWFAKFSFVARKAADALAEILDEGGRLGFLNFDPDRCDDSTAEQLFRGQLAMESAMRPDKTGPEIWLLRKRAHVDDSLSVKAIART
jgi:hypothetical protein